MKPIGGFFELELNLGKSLYHDEAIKLTTGRACLSYTLDILKPDKVYLPYYCCDALFEPMALKGIIFEFYPINEQLELSEHVHLKAGEILIYCNFFGLKQQYVNRLIERYGNQLLLDDTHTFFQKGYKNNYSFTSARKYFGVPDGAFLYGPGLYDVKITFERNNSVSISHNYNRSVGNQEQAFTEFLTHEKSLGSAVQRISLISEILLSRIDYMEVRKKRNDNLNYLREVFDDSNLITFQPNTSDLFCYPLLLKNPIDRKKLFAKKIYIPNYWLDTVNRKERDKFPFEVKLSTELLPLPIDHRYSKVELSNLSDAIKALIS